MTTNDEYSCAVWYERHGVTSIDVFDTEEEAAGFAVYLASEGQGVPLGVQFADGRTLELGDWTAFADRERLWQAEEDRAAARPGSDLPDRPLRSPFTGGVAEVGADAPEWLWRVPRRC